MSLGNNTKTALILTLNWNQWDLTARLVRSIIEQKLETPIWVIDNGSDKSETDSFRDVESAVTVKRLDLNCGFSGGVNFGVKLARESGFEFVYVINNDCLVYNDFLTPLLKMAHDYPKIAVLGSRYASVDKNDNLITWGFRSDPSSEKSYVNGVMLTDRVVGCGMLLRSSLFVDYGGFDERFFCYGEENELCIRLSKLGYDVGMCFGSCIKHKHKGSDTGCNALYYLTRNKFLITKLHPDIKEYQPDHMPIVQSIKGLLAGNQEVFIANIEGLFHGRSGIFGKRERQSFALSVALFLYYILLYSAPLVRYFFRKRNISAMIV
jgi:GT2 family glycosyltransferase